MLGHGTHSERILPMPEPSFGQYDLYLAAPGSRSMVMSSPVDEPLSLWRSTSPITRGVRTSRAIGASARWHARSEPGYGQMRYAWDRLIGTAGGIW